MTGQVRSLFESGDGLELALDAQRRARIADAEQFDHLIGYLTDCTDEPTDPRLPGGERQVQYGGSGTPQVSEFAVCEVGSVLGLSPVAAGVLVGDLLDIGYRLPLLDAALHRGDVDAWRVRKVASATRDFTLAQVTEVDCRLSAETIGDGTPMLCRVSRSRLNAILEQIRTSTRPEDADQDSVDARNERNVRIRPATSGVSVLDGLVSVEDGERLDQRLHQVVGWLRVLGDERGTGVLRSVALGYLAEPDSLDLLYDQVTRARTYDADAVLGEGDADPGAARTGKVPKTFSGTPRRLPQTIVYLHLDRASGTWSMEGAGPVSRADAAEIVGHAKVTVKPVIDLAANVTYTGYVAPPRLREQLALMNAGVCTFPSCNRPARHADYDHIVDYHHGGATSSRNGHRLCRFHHRAKTFTEWQVQSPAPGVWLWTSPTGRQYLVTAGSTTRLDVRQHRRTTAA